MKFSVFAFSLLHSKILHAKILFVHFEATFVAQFKLLYSSVGQSKKKLENPRTEVQ